MVIEISVAVSNPSQLVLNRVLTVSCVETQCILFPLLYINRAIVLCDK